MLRLLQAETFKVYYKLLIVDVTTETVADSENSSHYDLLY